MSEERPRYGELAPEGWQWPPAETSANSAGTATKPQEERSSRPRNVPDLIGTVLLLIVGLLISSSMTSAFFDLRNTLSEAFALQGRQAFIPSSATEPAGIVGAITTMALYLATLALSTHFLLQKRVAFYLPVICGIVTSILWIVCLAVAVMGNPGFS